MVYVLQIWSLGLRFDSQILNPMQSGSCLIYLVSFVSFFVGGVWLLGNNKREKTREMNHF